MDSKQLLEQIKKLEWKKLIYPAISTFFFLLVLLLFISGVKFLSNSINKTFTVDETTVESELTRVNFNNLNIVAKKLGIEIRSADNTDNNPSPVPQEQPIEPAPAPQPEPPPSNEVLGPTAPTPVPAPVEDKQSLKIEVLNSTKTAGLAGDLKNLIEAGGFVVKKTGNSSPVAETTTIKAKADKQSSFPASLAELTQIVSGKYAVSSIETLEADSAYDIVITIGAK